MYGRNENKKFPENGKLINLVSEYLVWNVQIFHLDRITKYIYLVLTMWMSIYVSSFYVFLIWNSVGNFSVFSLR